MGVEQDRYRHALLAAETWCAVLELKLLAGELDLDAQFRRLKDLNDYGLEHADILGRREGVEMLAIAMFFGMSSLDAYRPNYKRVSDVAPETLAYPGEGKRVAKQIKRREAHAREDKKQQKKEKKKKKRSDSKQKRLPGF